MAAIFVTGSSEGLGLMTARLLAEQGHSVVLHARNAQRAEDARLALPAADAVLVGDVGTLAGMHTLADQANAWGRFDAVIHNVGLGYREPQRVATLDGLSQLWAVNVLAPYVLTARLHRPDRLVYLSSGMHAGGDATLADLQWADRRWNGSQAYSDTKFQDVLLAFGVARRWPAVLSNAVSPGWVRTRMGGPGASDDLAQGPVTQGWLAVSQEPAAQVSGQLFYHLKPARVHPGAHDEARQEQLLEQCRALSGVVLAAEATSPR